MKWILLFLLVAVAGAVVAWPEGQPNCAVAGNWSDPEKKERMGISTTELGNGTIHQVVYNMSGVALNGTGNLGDGRAAAVRVSSSNESLLLHIICHNNVLWVMQTPLLTSHRMVRVFTLSRVAPPQLPPLPVEQDATSPPSTAPRYLLVNITIPKREDDDLGHPCDDIAQLDSAIANGEDANRSHLPLLTKDDPSDRDYVPRQNHEEDTSCCTGVCDHPPGD